MDQTRTPRWAPAVPALQAVVVAGYGLLVLLAADDRVADPILFVLVLGAPLVFGAAWALGWWVERRRGALRPDGSEYMVATIGNVLMGFGFAASVLMWMALLWVNRGLRDF